MNQTAYLAGGCFWGETVWETVSRLIAKYCETTSRNNIANEWTVPVRNKRVTISYV